MSTLTNKLYQSRDVILDMLKNRGFNIKWKGQKRALELKLDSKNPNSFQLSSKRDVPVSSVPSNHAHWQLGEPQEELGGGGGDIWGKLSGGDVWAALSPS